VIVPGEIELDRLARQMRDGIDIGPAQLAMLRAVADSGHQRTPG
jgi:ureidoglycolate dehydrogenase (NAD+)